MILSCPSVTMKVYEAGVLEGFKAFIEEAFCLDVMFKAMLFFLNELHLNIHSDATSHPIHSKFFFNKLCCLLLQTEGHSKVQPGIDVFLHP